MLAYSLSFHPTSASRTNREVRGHVLLLPPDIRKSE